LSHARWSLIAARYHNDTGMSMWLARLESNQLQGAVTHDRL